MKKRPSIALLGNSEILQKAVNQRFLSGNVPVVSHVYDPCIKRGMLCAEQHECLFIESAAQITGELGCDEIIIDVHTAYQCECIRLFMGTKKAVYVVITEDSADLLINKASEVKRSQHDLADRLHFVFLQPAEMITAPTADVELPDIGQVLNVCFRNPATSQLDRITIARLLHQTAGRLAAAARVTSSNGENKIILLRFQDGAIAYIGHCASDYDKMVGVFGMDGSISEQQGTISCYAGSRKRDLAGIINTDTHIWHLLLAGHCQYTAEAAIDISNILHALS